MINKSLQLTFLALISLSFNYPDPIQSDDKKDMVFIKSGIFLMGVDSAERKTYTSRFNVPEGFFAAEYPTRRYSVSAFYLDKLEVTNANFKAFIVDNPEWSKTKIARNYQDGNYLRDWTENTYPKGKANYPVTYISWYAATAYASWIGKRLPMEVEMEYAAKAGQKGAAIPSGNDVEDKTRANYLASGLNQTIKVGHYPANTFGIYDLAGNVAEMTADIWRRNLNVFGKNTNADSVAVRGGSWASPAVELLPAYRKGHAKNECSGYIGFRCAANAPAKK